MKHVLFLGFLIFTFVVGSVNAELKPSFYEYTKIEKQILVQLPNLMGWCSTEKAKAMMQLVRTVKPKVCVEIGVFGGRSLIPSAAVLKYLDGGIIYGIDPWKNNECTKYLEDSDSNKKWWAEVNLYEAYTSCISNIKNMHLEKYCKIYKETAQSAAKKFPFRIDILHIDGDRSEESMLSYVQIFFPKVRKEGYIWLNDVFWTVNNKQSSQKALEYLLDRCDIVDAVDNHNCILFQKR